MTLGKRLYTVIDQLSWEKAFFLLVELSIVNGLEMTGHSVIKLHRDCTVTFIHIMVMKCVSFIATWPILRGNLMIGPGNCHERMK